MSSPKYSIVIPTRDRARTLRYCLQTCVNIDYDDVEIIVSDNHSADDTPQVVKEFSSAKIKYWRTDRSLSMCKSWEFALSHASGEWVTFIGDDDGILPSALRQMDRTLSQLPVRLLRWEPAYYIWPDPAIPHLADSLRIPLTRSMSILDSKESIRQVLREELFVGYLPGLYHGAVHRSLIDEVLRSSGQVFVGWVPDHIAAYSFGYLAKRYARLSFPLTMCGHSPKSNGGDGLRRGIGATAEFFELVKKDGLEFHPWLPWPVIDQISGFLSPFLQAKDRFFPHDDELRVSRKEVITKVLRWYACHQRHDWDMATSVLRKSLANEPQLQQWYEHHVQHEWATTASVPHEVPSFKGRGYENGQLQLDAAEFGVADVAAAVALCDKLLGLRKNLVDHVVPAQGRLDRMGLPRPVIGVLRKIASMVRKGRG